MKLTLKKSVMVLFVIGMVVTSCFAKEVKITGKISKVEADFTAIVIDGKTITGTKEDIESAMFEVGDKVEIVADDKDGKLVMTSYEYVYENVE